MTNSKAIEKLLDRASKAYYNGSPIMTDAEFDVLASKHNYQSIGADNTDNTVEHTFKMYSLAKVLDEEQYNIQYNTDQWVCTNKLDGAAVEVTYINGILAVAATRGDGTVGQDVTDKLSILVPNKLKESKLCKGIVQVTGELVVKDKTIENSRNFASGSLAIKDLETFKEKATSLVFIVYGVQSTQGSIEETYKEDMATISSEELVTIIEVEDGHNYPTDGLVYRLNDNREFYKLGYTNRHPRGAYARKQSSDVEVKETKLLDVIWQVGSSGKVTPVAIFEEVIIDDAKITRATLHNPGFIEELGGLFIGDILLVTRSGGIIPKILGKV